MESATFRRLRRFADVLFSAMKKPTPQPASASPPRNAPIAITSHIHQGIDQPEVTSGPAVGLVIAERKSVVIQCELSRLILHNIKLKCVGAPRLANENGSHSMYHAHQHNCLT